MSDGCVDPRCCIDPRSCIADRSLTAFGVAPERIARWEPGVDRTRFSPACYGSQILPDAFNVLYAARREVARAA